MSIKVIYDRSLIDLLNSIFYENPDESDEFFPLIKNAKNLPNIIPVLSYDTKNEINLNNAISLIYYLKNIFSENSDLIPLFVKYCHKNRNNLIEKVINLYLTDKFEGQSLTLIEDLLSNITYNISIPKNIIAYIYQKLNIYFNISQNIQYNNNTILTEQLLLKYLKLLNIFYTDIRGELKNENKEEKKKHY